MHLHLHWSSVSHDAAADIKTFRSVAIGVDHCRSACGRGGRGRGRSAGGSIPAEGEFEINLRSTSILGGVRS